MCTCIQRKYIRGLPNPLKVKSFHQQFLKWLDNNFSFGVSDTEWDAIIENDSSYPYSTHLLTELQQVQGTGTSAISEEEHSLLSDPDLHFAHQHEYQQLLLADSELGTVPTEHEHPCILLINENNYTLELVLELHSIFLYKK